MSKTIDDLKAAFAGESQANRKYLAFARKAEEEGLPQIAKLFRAVAAAETVHAHNHLKAMDGVKSTAENLQAAIAGENYEVVSMYPPMLAEAEAEGDKRAARSFRWALEVEKIHEAHYRKAAEIQSKGKDVPAVEYNVCPICGYTHEGPMEGNCPVCNLPGEKFERIE
ncbi:MAG: rubrerythrin family protein [Anaerolineales bacterium]|nr:rubrerythrin family protein [Anaerolineales bacterium]